MAEITLLKDIANAIRQSSASGTEAYDTSAIVVRTEGSTAWVHIPGGVDETPVEMSINASAGDTVRVRVSGGQAWLIGNNTAPPTDDRRAKEAATFAEHAQSTANQAVKNAEDAARAAEDAQNSADNARISANNARVDAGRANTAANNALTQLSVVEDVVGVLTWISEHGSYAISVDTEVVEGKFYFTREGSGTEADPYHYNLVISPSGDPSALGYYELTGIDEAVTNYIASHLALTDAGLWVTKDSNGYKILVSNSAVAIYDPEGELVVTYGDSIRFSSSRPQYIGGEDAYIIFYDADEDGVADSIRIGGSKVYIGGGKKLSDVLTSLDISTSQTASGAEIDIAGKKVQLSNGADAVTLRIDSSRGVLFKNNVFATVLTVTIQKGAQNITDAATMRTTFGSGAYLQWYWRKFDDDDWGIMSILDSHISDGGFTLTVTPDDVDEKIVFKCDLEV